MEIDTQHSGQHLICFIEFGSQKPWSLLSASDVIVITSG